MALIIDITSRCNMCCRHCMWSRTGKGEDMSLDVFARALDLDLARTGIVSLGTAEPTVHPQFWTFLQLALDKAIKVRVVTNGKKTECALRLAELGRLGTIQAHLSVDEFHEAIDPAVVEAFRRDPELASDKRAFRGVSAASLKRFGRCDFAGSELPTCRCPIPRIVPDGTVYACGCEAAEPIGNVMTGNVQRKLLVSRPGCARHLPNADVDADRRFARTISSTVRRGSSAE